MGHAADGTYPAYELDVVEGNEGVIPLYESVGFQEIGREKENMAWLKGFKHRTIMELVLADRLTRN